MREGPLATKEARAKEKTRAQEQRARLKGDFGAVLSRPEGRRFFFRLCDEIAGLRNVALPGTADSDRAFHDGSRWVGAQLMEDALLWWPEYVTQGHAEWIAQSAREELERKNAREDREAATTNYAEGEDNDDA